MVKQCLGFLIKNFPNEITWYQVKIECSKLEDGWRIPTNNDISILNVLHNLYERTAMYWRWFIYLKCFHLK